MKKLLYFGCINEVGHYWFSHNDSFNLSKARLQKELPYVNHHLLDVIDGIFPPMEYARGYNVSRVGDCLIVAWWDNSVDKRPGSSSTFLGYKYQTVEEIFQDARKLFPSVMNRQETPPPYNSKF